MRFEKINENQMKCTLTGDDLRARHIMISELTYGGDKARVLFDEMLEKANTEYDFETTDYPVMIEAIPVSSESLMLLITRMEDPEELDPRFAQFSPEHREPDELADLVPEGPKVGADDLLKLLSEAFGADTTVLSADSFKSADSDADEIAPSYDGYDDSDELEERADHSRAESRKAPAQALKIFCFRSLDAVSDAARAVRAIFAGSSTLYKSPDAKYYLAVRMDATAPEDFNRTCNLLSEYGEDVRNLPAGEAYYSEHCEALVEAHAIEAFALI